MFSKNGKTIYEPYLDFWLPNNKYSFVNFLTDKYPNIPMSKWLNMTSKRLRAIYLAIRTKRG